MHEAARGLPDRFTQEALEAHMSTPNDTPVTDELAGALFPEYDRDDRGSVVVCRSCSGLVSPGRLFSHLIVCRAADHA